jgi:hypothetical protein
MDGFGWICVGPLSGGEAKNRAFVWWLDLAGNGPSGLR